MLTLYSCQCIQLSTIYMIYEIFLSLQFFQHMLTAMNTYFCVYVCIYNYKCIQYYTVYSIYTYTVYAQYILIINCALV